MTCGSIGTLPQAMTGLHLAADRPQQDLAGALRGLVGVDMRIGAVAGDHRRVVDHRRRRGWRACRGDRDRRLRIDRADAAQEFALAVLQALGDHRAVQVEHDAVEAALRDGLADAVGDVLEGRVLDRARSAARRRRSAARSRPSRARRDRDRRRAPTRCPR